MKTCSKCGESKALGEFHRDARNSDGRQVKCKTCVAAYYAANREDLAAYSRSYYAANREQSNARQRAYRAANPHITWGYNYRQRALRSGHLPVIEPFTRDDVIERYGDACAHCGGDFEELDHYPVPVAQGGTHTLQNVRPSCADCNQRTWRQDVATG